MTTKLAKLIVFLFAIFLSNPEAIAREPYRPGDWTSYTVLRYVTSIAADFEHIYFATTGGVSVYNRIRDEWEPPLTTSDGLLDNNVTVAAYDQDNDEIWFGTRSGVCIYKPVFHTWYTGGAFPMNLVQSGKSDTLLPGFFMDYGYNFYSEGYITDLYLNRYPVTVHYKDDWDDLWLGTWGLNVGLGSLRDLQLRMFKIGLYDSDVNAICLDKGAIWVGGRGFSFDSEAITRFDRNKNVWEYFEPERIGGLDNGRVNSIDADPRYVWFGTQDGLVRYDKRKSRWITFSTFKGLRDDWVTALKSDGDMLWIGTKSGLNFYLSRKDTLGYFRNRLVDNTYISSIEADSEWLWVGTEWGVVRMNKSNGDWSVFSTPDGILNSPVRSIARNRNVLWFATDSGILSYDLLTDSTRVYMAKVSFPGSGIRKILCDDKNLWVATFQGAWKMNLKNEVWRLFEEEDGLLDDDVQDMVLDGDNIWFGTPEGLTRFFWKTPYIVD